MVSGPLQGFPQISAPLVYQGTLVPTQPWYRFFIELWMRSGAAAGNGAAITGEVRAYAAAAVPSGWLPCDGSAVSRSGFANLFATIGTVWGPGDGATTFNVPDLRDKGILGSGGGHPVGAHGGSAAASLGIANLPAHNHPVSDPGHDHVFTGTPHTHTVTDPTHVHTVTDPGHHHTAAVGASTGTTGTDAVGASAGNTGSAVTGLTVNAAATGITLANTTAAGTIGSNTTGVTTGNTGSGTPIATQSPFAALVYMIRT